MIVPCSTFVCCLCGLSFRAKCLHCSEVDWKTMDNFRVWRVRWDLRWRPLPQPTAPSSVWCSCHQRKALKRCVPHLFSIFCSDGPRKCLLFCVCVYVLILICVCVYLSVYCSVCACMCVYINLCVCETGRERRLVVCVCVCVCETGRERRLVVCVCACMWDGIRGECVFVCVCEWDRGGKKGEQERVCMCAGTKLHMYGWAWDYAGCILLFPEFLSGKKGMHRLCVLYINLCIWNKNFY